MQKDSLPAGLYELKAFMAVAAHRNFRSAANELGLTPSALSHSIAALEKKIGVRLFNRTTRSVAVTSAGEAFLSRVGPALREISAAMESVNQFRDRPTGLIRINSSRGASRDILLPVVFDYMRRYPEMRVEVVTEDRLIDIVKDGFDAGVRLREDLPQDMVAIPIGPKKLAMAVVASPSYFKQRPKPKVPEDLLKHECVRYRMSNGGIYRWEFEKRGRAIDVEVKGSLTVDYEELSLEAALAGRAITYAIDWRVTEHLRSGRLVRVLEDWTPAFPGLCFYYPSHRNHPAGLRLFIDLLRERKGN